MNSEFFSEEKHQNEGTNKCSNVYTEDTSKSRSPVMSSNLFSFNSQEVLTLDMETEECPFDIIESANTTQFDDYEEHSGEWSVYLNKGGKRKMEDRFRITKHEKNSTFFGIYDGHGSSEIAELLSEKLHTYIFDNPNFENDPMSTILNSFLKLDYEILESQSENGKNIGSVAICCIIIGDILYVVNLGDSRAVLIDQTGEAKSLSNEHTPNRPDERERIEKLGGVVLVVHDQERIMGELAVSRSFGDKFYKPFVSGTPEILAYKLDKDIHKYIVLASDGLWNEISNQELESLIKGKEVENLAKEIYDEIIEQKSFFMDNTSIICIDVVKLLENL